MFLERKKPLDIDSGIEEFRKDLNAVLVDVREIDEYSESYIEGSINIPLSTLDNVLDVLKDKNQSIYVYCRSGNRSSKAETKLKNMGYTKVKNIGGIMYCNTKYVKENN